MDTVITGETRTRTETEKNRKVLVECPRARRQAHTRSLKMECIQSKRLDEMLTDERGYVTCYGCDNNLVRASE